jgi:TusA-related sulfurtransferase
MKADQTLDCMGLYCPMPIYETSVKIKDLKIGEILEVIGDDPGIKKDMPAWAEATGNKLLDIEEEAGEIRSYVKRTK